MSKETFTTDLKLQTSTLYDGLRNRRNNPDGVYQSSEVDTLIESVCEFILENADSIVFACEHSCQYLGRGLLSRISTYFSLSVEDKFLLCIVLYRFFVEFSIVDSNYRFDEVGGLCFSLRDYIENFDVHDKSTNAIKHYTLVVFPSELVRSQANGKFLKYSSEQQQIIEDISKYKDSDVKVSKVLTQLESWDLQVEGKFERIDALNKELKNLSSSYNFANISHGFQNLLSSKEESLKYNSFIVFALSFVLIAPPIYKIFFGSGIDLDSYRNSVYYLSILIDYVPIVILDFFILYFFRIALSTRKEITTQIVQLELRKSLCQFIESYSEKSKEMASATPNLLDKFETLIFSGLTTDPANVPTTFDGFEQLANMIKSFKNP